MERLAGSAASMDFMPNGGVEQNTTGESITSDSPSPLIRNEKIHSRFLSPHVASCHDFCKYGKKHDSDVEAMRVNFRNFLKKKKKKSAQNVGQSEVTILVAWERRIETGTKACVTPIQFKPSPASDMEATEQPNIIEQKTKSSIMKSILPVAPKVIQRKASPSVSEAQTLKPKVPRLPKRVDGSGNHAITLKTKTPLRRSPSQHKSSKSLVARSNEENKSMRSPGTSRNGGSDLAEPSTVSSFSKSSRTRIDQRNMDNKMAKSIATSKIGERKQLKPTPSFFSSKTHDNASSSQLRKLGSIKRTSTPHGNVLGSQLRKLGSIKRNRASQNNVSSLQPRKPRRAKQTLKPRDNASSLQPRKLRSIKRTSTPLEMVSSLQTRKIRNTKQTSTFHDIVLRFQPRKLRSMKRSSSVKDNKEVDNANAESSVHSIHEVTDTEIEGNDKVDISEHHEEKSRRSINVHTSIPFKMKFRRGKVINLRSDSMRARRLWFNIGRLASDNPDGGGTLWMKSFSQKRSASIDSIDPDSEAQSVVLKHQGVAEKKDNHVIEETASKLVETRNSKVRALVGVFETLISLQQRKPAPRSKRGVLVTPLLKFA